MKCESCSKKIEETFLNKAVGTMMKDAKGKRHWFCRECQRVKQKTDPIK